MQSVQGCLKYAFNSISRKGEHARETFCCELIEALEIPNREDLGTEQTTSIDEETFLEFIQEHISQTPTARLALERHCWKAILKDDWDAKKANMDTVIGEGVAFTLWRLFACLSGGELQLDTSSAIWLTQRVNIFATRRRISACIHGREIMPAQVARGESTYWQILDRAAGSLTSPTQERQEVCVRALENLLMEASERILKQGYLLKRGHVRKNWKKRWFVLMPGELKYYISDGEEEAIGTCYLTRNSKVRLVHGQSSMNHRFMVTCGRTAKDFEVSAESEQDRDNWMEYIAFAIEHRVTTLEHLKSKVEDALNLVSSYETSCNIQSVFQSAKSIMSNSCRYQVLKDLIDWIKLLLGIAHDSDSGC